MNDLTFFFLSFIAVSTNFHGISLENRVKDLDNKVTIIQQNQEQIIQLIESNQ